MFLLTPLWATHNRSGDITYKHLYGNTYEFTITTCTKLTAEADRPELEIFYGDGSSDTIQRIVETPYPSTDTKINIYKGVHTYTGAGTFIIQMQDPNRNTGILNISNSVDKIFCIQSKLVISPFIGTPNNSIIMEECPCPEYACLNKPWIYNVAAYDPDGDSVSYALIPCKGEDCIDMTIPAVYQYPQNVGGGTMTMNPVTGTLIWNSPGLIGEYNLAIIIYEYRKGILVGFVIRDMQLTVQACNNEPPKIDPINDACVQVGQPIHQAIHATDPDAGNVMSFEVYGQPYQFATNPSTFSSTPAALSVFGVFDWMPDCAAIRSNPYPLVFEVSDNAGSFALNDILVWNITVNAPAVQNLQVNSSGNTLNLSWSPYPCSPIKKYKIYRSTDSTNTTIGACCYPNQAGDLGYELVGSTTGLTDTTFSDANVVIGNRYCYIVTAILDNGTESCISQQICGQLDFAIPILTNVSIESTSTNTGKDTIRWQHPTELNQVQFPGPYSYKLYSALGSNTPNLLVFTTSTQAILQNCDTLFQHTNLNTSDSSYSYRVELWSNGILVGSSAASESVFLTLVPNDNQLALTWHINTNWFVDSSEVYRETTAGSGIFNPIGWSYTNTYTDLGLVNGVQYCYKIKTFGHYSLPEIHAPLINWSQENCGTPSDFTAPCAPTLTLEQDCDLGKNRLIWNNPNNSCADDVTHYAVYYSQYDDDNFTKVVEIDGASDTLYLHSTDAGVSGCYYVTAFDSIQYNNESVASNKICIENCTPDYQLPNVITPNDDGMNDFFHPILPYRFVSRVECSLFNRWGEIIFETQDPMINWDGKESKKGREVSEGVYFYLCKVYFIGLEGEKSIQLQGFFHVIHNK